MKAEWLEKENEGSSCFRASQTGLSLGELRDWCIWSLDDMGAGSNVPMEVSRKECLGGPREIDVWIWVGGLEVLSWQRPWGTAFPRMRLLGICNSGQLPVVRAGRLFASILANSNQNGTNGWDDQAPRLLTTDSLLFPYHIFGLFQAASKTSKARAKQLQGNDYTW